MKTAISQSLIKPAILGVLILLMMVPLSSVHDIIQDRVYNRDTAKHSIAQSWANAQVVGGPWLVVNYQQTEWVKTSASGFVTEKTELREKVIKKTAWLRAADLAVQSDLEVNYRYRGIFKVPTYQSDITMQSTLELAGLAKLLAEDETTVITSAWLSFDVSDPRGFAQKPEVVIDGENYKVRPNSGGFTVPVDDLFWGESVEKNIAQLAQTQKMNIKVDFTLNGMGSISFKTAALENQIEAHSAWQHPSFYGDFLPTARTVGEQGFEAKWQLSSFATGVNNEPQVYLAEESPACISDKLISVDLYDPVDIYVLNDRASKYGMMFVIFVFAAFYLFETLKKTDLHPIKYTMVGLALAVFFLLLLSLSEKIGFTLAYVLAAAASIGLICFYMKPNFSKGGTITLAGVLSVMFGAILTILKSESESLLIGSVLIFMTLAAVMFSTRHAGVAEDKRA